MTNRNQFTDKRISKTERQGWEFHKVKLARDTIIEMQTNLFSSFLSQNPPSSIFKSPLDSSLCNLSVIFL